MSLAESQNKNCRKCGKNLPISMFNNDKSRPDGRYPYCKDCRRLMSGSKKRRQRIPKPCSHCGVEFLPRRLQIDSNKTGRFFCCDLHKRLWLRDNSELSHGRSYRDHILDRDRHCCCLCSKTSNLHVHHIITRGAGGTDEFHNLITLCQSCHLNKAHGPEQSQMRLVFQGYTSQFERPDYWDEIMEMAKRQTEQINKNRAKAKKRWRESIKGTEAWRKEKEKSKRRSKEFQDRHKQKYGCSYSTLQYRAKKLSIKRGIRHSEAAEIVRKEAECNTSGAKHRKNPKDYLDRVQ